MSCQQACVK